MTARLAVLALGWPAGLWLLWSLPRPRPAAPSGDPARRISVVVPARDEAASLPALLDALAGTDGAQVVVVDDHSTDGTAAVAAASGAIVVAAPPLPAGWTGKCWACWTGAGATTGDTLVFLDADTEPAPGGLDRILAEHRRRGGLVSVQPYHRTERPYEALSAYFNVVPWMGLGAATPTAGRRSPPGAFGPCLVTARADYERTGGHEAVRGEVVEDVALAARYRDAGLPVTALAGKGTVAFRMYRGGIAQLVEGWTKNMAGGAAASRPGALALAVLWIAGGIVATIGPVVDPGPAAVAAYGAYAAQLAWMLARLGRFPWWTAVVFPVPLAFFLAVFTRSLVRTHLRGEVRWRGRTIPTRTRTRTGRTR